MSHLNSISSMWMWEPWSFLQALLLLKGIKTPKKRFKEGNEHGYFFTQHIAHWMSCVHTPWGWKRIPFCHVLSIAADIANEPLRTLWYCYKFNALWQMGAHRWRQLLPLLREGFLVKDKAHIFVIYFTSSFSLGLINISGPFFYEFKASRRTSWICCVLRHRSTQLWRHHKKVRLGWQFFNFCESSFSVQFSGHCGYFVKLSRQIWRLIGLEITSPEEPFSKGLKIGEN